MAISFHSKRTEFSGYMRELAKKDDSVMFDLPPAQAEVAIRGFMVQFEGSEHPVQNIQVNLDQPKIEGCKVTYKVTLGIKDNTGSYDDKYGGWVDVLAIANFQ